MRPPAAGLRRVLAVRLDNLGDVLMTTPALAAVRQGLPDAHLTLLTSPVAAAVAPHLTMVDAVWSCSVPWLKPAGGDTAPGAGRPGEHDTDHDLGRAEAALVDRLAEGRFDAALIFTVCTQSALPTALLCRMAGIPVRVAHCRENPYGLLTHWLPETDQVVPGLPPEQQRRLVRHEVQRQLALVAALDLHIADDRLHFQVQASDRRRVRQQLQAAGITPGTAYAVLHPGATAESRRWPARHFGAAARDIAASGCAVVFSGNTGDIPLAQQALRAMQPDDAEATAAAEADALAPAPPRARATAAAGAVSLAGQQTLGELAALIEGARVLVANNSAAAHLAAALGTPVVDLYALTNPQHTPWRVACHVLHHDVPCRWCLKSVCPEGHHDCLRRVPPEHAASAAIELMNRPPRDRTESHAP